MYTLCSCIINTKQQQSKQFPKVNTMGYLLGLVKINVPYLSPTVFCIKGESITCISPRNLLVFNCTKKTMITSMKEFVTFYLVTMG